MLSIMPSAWQLRQEASQLPIKGIICWDQIRPCLFYSELLCASFAGKMILFSASLSPSWTPALPLLPSKCEGFQHSKLNLQFHSWFLRLRVSFPYRTPAPEPSFPATPHSMPAHHRMAFVNVFKCLRNVLQWKCLSFFIQVYSPKNVGCLEKTSIREDAAFREKRLREKLETLQPY